MTITINYSFSIILAVLTIIGTYHIFKKAGDKGWKAIIPFYNGYTLYKHIWNVKSFWIMLAATIMCGACSEICKNISSPIAIFLVAILGIAAGITAIVYRIKEVQKLAHAFGHKGWFTVGLFFFGPIFMMILGLGKSEYCVAA